MTLALVLGVSAAVLLLWPRSAAEQRVARLGGPSARRRWALSDPWLLVWGLPVAGVAVFGVASAIAGALVAWLITSRRRRAGVAARRARDTRELVQALSVMCAELSVGAPTVVACRTAADELRRTEPSSAVAEELSKTAARAELGGDPDSGSARSGPAARLAHAWTMSLEFGVPIADMLDALRDDLTARRDFETRTAAGLAGPRATAAVLAGLPVLGILLGEGMGAHPLRVLLNGGVGGGLLVVGTLLAVGGVRWSDRIAERAVRP